jgi:hypothetical protein
LHPSPFHILSLSLSNLERNTACNRKVRNQSKNPRLAADVIPQNLNPCLLDDNDGKFQIVTILSPFSYKKRGKRETGKPE